MSLILVTPCSLAYNVFAFNNFCAIFTAASCAMPHFRVSLSTHATLHPAAGAPAAASYCLSLMHARQCGTRRRSSSAYARAVASVQRVPGCLIAHFNVAAPMKVVTRSATPRASGEPPMTDSALWAFTLPKQLRIPCSTSSAFAALVSTQHAARQLGSCAAWA